MKKLFKKMLVLWTAATFATFLTACNPVPPPVNSGESSANISSVESSVNSENSSFSSSLVENESTESSTSSETSSNSESSSSSESAASDGTGTSESIESVSNAEKENAYTVHFDLQYKKAQMSITELSVEYGETYTLPKPTCSGYIFTGWKMKDTNAVFAETGVYDLRSDVELVAQWKIDETSLDGWGNGH